MIEVSNRRLWTIVLAGGDGVRLRQLTRALHGEECPKQFATIHGGRSLLQWTVARALRWSTPDRIMVVVAAEREDQARRQLVGLGPIDVVAQPSNRGTGPGMLLPIARIMARDPEARVVVMPSDHYVRDEGPFEHSIRLAIAASADMAASDGNSASGPHSVCNDHAASSDHAASNDHAASQGRVALIGAVPDHAETQYGWIVPGKKISPRRGSVVNHFCEKPPPALAERLLRQGALWNTFIMAGAVRQFWALGAEHLPAATSLLELYRRAVDGSDEGRTLGEIYRYMPVSDFSRDVLQKASGLRVVPLEECGWSDWGTPERVLDSLRHHDDFAVLSRRLAIALLCP